MDSVMGSEMGEGAGCGRVAVGMSGGVDSSVAAALLLRAGFDVVGVTCRFVDDGKTAEAVRDAAAVCSHLGIEHHVHDCMERFSRTVSDPFVRAYAQGLTPSPCVACNAACKVPSLLEAAAELGCDAIATGHYAQVERVAGRFAIKRSYTDKDQSYMLAMLPQEQLARIMLPLGGMDKQQVRALADGMGLPVAQRPDSQDICFIDGSHIDFLRANGVAFEPGEIVSVDGRVLGRHEGLARYTLGQRKGIGVGGLERPLFAIAKRAAENRLVVGPEEATMIRSVEVSGLNWQAADPIDLVRRFVAHGPVYCTVKLRYRSQAVGCYILPADFDGDVDMEFSDICTLGESRGQAVRRSACGSVGRLHVVLAEPAPITAPGQYAVLYRGGTVLGAGMIERICGEETGALA